MDTDEKYPLEYQFIKNTHLNLLASCICIKIEIRPDLKICWVAVTRVYFFEYTRPVGKKKIFYHFEMEKVALILIYNIFVTKKIFFRNEHQKNLLTRTFLVDPVG